MAAANEMRFLKAEDLLEYLRPSSDRWWDSQANRPSHFFRGHGDCDWKLIASGLRPLGEKNSITVLVERVRQHLLSKGCNEDATQDAFEFRAWAYALDEGYRRFSAICERIGLPAVYLPMSSIFDLSEKWPKPELRVRHIEPHAQHHGVPSALLDWTANPFTAAYFAVDNAETADPCVWALERCETYETVHIGGDGWRMGLHFPTYPAVENNFKRLQRGHFTSLINQELWFRTHGQWPSLDDYNDLRRGPSVLTKITFPRSEAERVRQLLYREGVSLADLMPSYDYAAKEVKQSFSWL